MGDANEDPEYGFDSSILIALSGALSPVELTPAARAALKQRILQRLREPVCADVVTVRADDGMWEQVSELVRVKVLRDDRSRSERTFLIEFLPGARYPAHVHAREETSLMLQGEIFIGDHPLRCGDLHVAPAGTWHAEVTSPKGGICFVRAAMPYDEVPTSGDVVTGSKGAARK